jgi:hypothetical protein
LALNSIRSDPIPPPALDETGHFYFAQTGHSHFAATFFIIFLTLFQRGSKCCPIACFLSVVRFTGLSKKLWEG